MTKTILITGAGSGFGKAAAITLASRGHRVIATTETADQASALAREQPSVETMKLDVTNADDVATAATLDVDVLVNNAGVGIMGPLATIPVDLIRTSFEVNVIGMAAMSQAVIPAMMAKGSGRIINVSSIAGVIASSMSCPYTMTKHAVEAFTKALRAELEPHGIDVTKVNPGPYNTGFNDRMVNGAAAFITDGDTAAAETHSFMQDVILKDQLDPAEVATAIADLAEADTTPPEVFLPEGIVDLISAML